MSSADFSAARERLAARARARDAASSSSRPRAPHASSSRLAAPLHIGSAFSAAWNSLSSREGTRPAFRVGQVDAELLDEELLELLKGQVGEGLKLLGSHLTDDYTAEILLALRAILFKLTIWDHNASYGASLQGLHYTDARSPSKTPRSPRRWQKGVYGLVTVFGRYSWAKWEDWLIARTDGTSASTVFTRRLADLTASLNTTHTVLSLLSFLAFLLNGRFRTLLDRALRLRLTPLPSSPARDLSFEYLNRQLVWHAFTEFLLFILPLVGISRWRRIVSRAYRRIVSFLRRTISRTSASSAADAASDDGPPSGELGFLPERTCAICYKDQTASSSEAQLTAPGADGGGGVVGSTATDISNPYAALPCGCLYCYMCIVGRIEAEEGEGWTCLRCGEVVKECGPWDGDVLEVKVPRDGENQIRSSSGGGKVVGFADDVRGNNDEDENGMLEHIEPRPEPEVETEDHGDAADNVDEGHSSVRDGDAEGEDYADSDANADEDWDEDSGVYDSSEVEVEREGGRGGWEGNFDDA